MEQIAPALAAAFGQQHSSTQADTREHSEGRGARCTHTALTPLLCAGILCSAVLCC